MVVVVFVINLLVSSGENIPRDIRRGTRAYGSTLDLNNIRRTEDSLRIYVFMRDRYA
jgi:hypothetical protein